MITNTSGVLWIRERSAKTVRARIARCPQCGANARFSCRTATGKRASLAHSRRVFASAMSAQLDLPETREDRPGLDLAAWASA